MGHSSYGEQQVNHSIADMSKEPKAAAPAALPTWQQTSALGLVTAEHVLRALTRLRFEDAEWSGDDWACDNAMDLALVAVQRMRQQTYKDSVAFEKDWYQVAGVVNLAARGFSGRNAVYAHACSGLVGLMDVLPDLVEHSWE